MWVKFRQGFWPTVGLYLRLHMMRLFGTFLPLVRCRIVWMERLPVTFDCTLNARAPLTLLTGSLACARGAAACKRAALVKLWRHGLARGRVSRGVWWQRRAAIWVRRPVG